MTLACHLVRLSFDDWAANPTVTTTDSAAYPIQNVPFPSVTVCHEDPGIRFSLIRCLTIIFKNGNFRSPERWAVVSSLVNNVFKTCKNRQNEGQINDCQSSQTSNPIINAVYTLLKNLLITSKENILEFTVPPFCCMSWTDWENKLFGEDPSLYPKKYFCPSSG